MADFRRFGVNVSPVIQKTLQTKSDASIVARVITFVQEKHGVVLCILTITVQTANEAITR